MWNLAKRVASPAPRKPASSKKGKEEPLASFTSTWESLEAALTAESSTKLPFGQSPIPRHLGQLLALLVAELPPSTPAAAAAPAAALAPCHEYLIQNGVLATIVSLGAKDDPPGARKAVITWVRQAVAALGEGFLLNGAVHRPAAKLVRLCVEDERGLSREEEEAIVDLSCQLCQSIQLCPELLAVFFREKTPAESKKKDNLVASGLPEAFSIGGQPDASEGSRSASPTPSNSTFTSSTSLISASATPRRRKEHEFFLLSHLLRFVHREGRIGDLARSGLVSLVEVAVHFPPVVTSSSTGLRTNPGFAKPSPSRTSSAREARIALAEYILDSDFSDVLGAGLGALYGLLPGKLLVRPLGSSTSRSATAWDDPAVESPGGMVLGGMGALEDDDDPDEAQRKREEEEDHLLTLGVGLSGTPDFRESLDGWLKLVEFTQDVLRQGSSTSEAGFSVDEDEDIAYGGDADRALQREQRLVASTLRSAVLFSIKTLFLPVLYTSILECSEADGSAVAVLSYLDAMLAVVEEGSALEASIVGFLLGEEDARDLRQERKTETSFLSPVTNKVKRRKSSALVLIESRAQRGHDAPASSYFTSLGRFSLKDLLASTLHSSSSATATAALKLLQTLLARHDRWSMGLLDVILDEGATYFPSPLRAGPVFEPEPSNGVIPDELDHSDSDDSDVFVYPSTPTPTPTPRSRPAPPSTPFTPSRLPHLLLGVPLPSTPSIAAHLDSLDTLLDLLDSIDPQCRAAKGIGGGFSTGLANYVQDAEVALAGDAGFLRGLAAGPAKMDEAVPVSPKLRRRSTLFGAAPVLSTRDFAQAKTAYRHRLDPASPLLALLLESLAEFFSHSPELNLSLTAALATLALYPYRSLEGWMLPAPTGSSSHAVDRFAGLAGLGKKKNGGSTSDDGDDRSVDYDVDEMSRHDALFTSTLRSETPRTTRMSPSGGGSLLSIVSALSASVSHYRSTIPQFDTYLSERRAGLHFVDNLADALDVNDEGNAFGDAVKGLEARGPLPATSEGSLSKPPAFGAFLFPLPPAKPRDAFTTPPRALHKQTSTASLQSSTGVSSPFAAHYRQTGSITITPVVVGTLRDTMPFEEGDEGDDGPPDSPTRRLSPAAPPPPASSVFSEEGSAASQSSPSRRRDREPVTVSLSVLLDNVLVLEEFVKEMTAIVLVRRGMGVDQVRFL